MQSPHARSTDADAEFFHVIFGPKDVRKITIEQLDDFYRLGLVNESTLLWAQGMSDWQTLADAAGLGEEEPPPPSRPRRRPPPRTSAPPPASRAAEKRRAMAASKAPPAQRRSSVPPPASRAAEKRRAMAASKAPPPRKKTQPMPTRASTAPSRAPAASSQAPTVSSRPPAQFTAIAQAHVASRLPPAAPAPGSPTVNQWPPPGFPSAPPPGMSSAPPAKPRPIAATSAPPASVPPTSAATFNLAETLEPSRAPRPSVQPASVPAPSQAPPVLVAPVAPSIPPPVDDSFDSEVFGRPKGRWRRRFQATLLWTSLISGITITLYRNDVLLDGARTLGLESTFLKLEQRWFGGPPMGTPRQVRQLMEESKATAAEAPQAAAMPSAQTDAPSEVSRAPAAASSDDRIDGSRSTAREVEDKVVSASSAKTPDAKSDESNTKPAVARAKPRKGSARTVRAKASRPKPSSPAKAEAKNAPDTPAPGTDDFLRMSMKNAVKNSASSSKKKKSGGAFDPLNGDL